jgi:hypothetical protein
MKLGEPIKSVHDTGKLAGIITIGAAGGLLLLTLAAAVTFLVSYQDWAELAAGQFGSGHSRFNETFYQGMVFRLRICGLLAGIAATGIWLGRRPLARHGGRILSSLAAEAREAGRDLLNLYARVNTVTLLLGIVLLVGLVLRLLYLTQPIRYDEASNYLFYVKPGLARILLLDYLPNNHILHTEIVWLLTHILGGSPVVMRIPALIAGLLLIPVTYQYVRRYEGSAAALFAAGLTAVNADLAMSSTNARGYTMVALFFMCLVQIAQRLGEDPQRIGLWVPFVGFAVLGLYTVPTMVYGVAAAAGILAVERLRCWKGGLWNLIRGGITDLVIAGAVVISLTALLYAPTMVCSGPSALFFNRFVRPESSNGFVARTFEGIKDTWKLWHSGWSTPVVVILTVCVLSGAIQFLRRRQSRTMQHFLLAIAICLIAAFCQRVIPPARIWVFLLPLYFAAVAGSLGRLAGGLGETWKSKGLIAATMLLLAWNVQSVWRADAVATTADGVNTDAGEIAFLLAEMHQNGDTLVATLPVFAPVMYYLDRLGQSYLFWSADKPARVMAILDKPAGREFTQAESESTIRLAFSSTIPDLDQSHYRATETLFDRPGTRVVMLKRNVR